MRSEVALWLHDHGYRQSFWVSDLNLDREQLQEELRAIGLPFEVRRHAALVSPRCAITSRMLQLHFQK